jgi:hypothetical protein
MLFNLKYCIENLNKYEVNFFSVEVIYERLYLTLKLRTFNSSFLKFTLLKVHKVILFSDY